MSCREPLMCLSERAEIGHGVLSYLVNNADAGDTLEGIVEWWLMEQKITQSAAKVENVLEEFSQRKLILKYKTSDDRIHYRINRDNEAEIQAALNSRE